MSISDSVNLDVFKQMPPLEAKAALDNIIEQDPKNEEAYILRGRKQWSLNNRREAINDYLKALQINPESKARMLLDQANAILAYYSKDLLNP